MTFWTAQILGLIGSLLAFTAVQTGSRLWLALFLACYGAAPLLTWDGPYCLLLGAAMMLTTAALWTRNMRLTRLLFLLNSPPVFAYNLIAGSYTGAAIEVAAFCSFALAVWRFDLRRPAALALPLRPDHSCNPYFINIFYRR